MRSPLFLAKGVEVAVITSGAVAAGMGKLGLTRETRRASRRRRPLLQQDRVRSWGDMRRFLQHSTWYVAQVLLTHERLEQQAPPI